MSHNPDNLTPEQIGNGYTLLTLEEVKANDRHRQFHPEIECWLKPDFGWHKGCIGNRWQDGPYTYRVPFPHKPA